MRYSVVVGLLFAVLVIIALVNTRGGGDGILGLDRYPHFWPLPEFAVPVAASELEGDANVAQDDCETAQVPCPQEARRVPACRVPGVDAIRVCDFFDRPLVISFWFSKEGNCIGQQDAVDATFERYRARVGFLSLNIRDDRDTVRDLIRERGWEMPVGYDHDGAVASLYRVGGCPTFAYVYPGGVLQSASSGVLTAQQLGDRVRGLLRAARNAEGG
jgi:hypothetical protein